jgi:hypothetical protein
MVTYFDLKFLNFTLVPNLKTELNLDNPHKSNRLFRSDRFSTSTDLSGDPIISTCLTVGRIRIFPIEISNIEIVGDPFPPSNRDVYLEISGQILLTKFDCGIGQPGVAGPPGIASPIGVAQRGPRGERGERGEAGNSETCIKPAQNVKIFSLTSIPRSSGNPRNTRFIRPFWRDGSTRLTSKQNTFNRTQQKFLNKSLFVGQYWITWKGRPRRTKRQHG